MGVKDPDVLLEKVTVPVGGVGAVEVSVTVAVHVVGWLTATLDGLQLTLVPVVDGEVASDITETVLEPSFATKTSPLAES